MTRQEQDQYIQDHFRVQTNREMGAATGMTFTNVANRLFRMGLKRDENDPVILRIYEAARNRGTPNKAGKIGGRPKLPGIIDQIECRYTENEIREMYGKLLAGRGKYTNANDIARKYFVIASQEKYDTVIQALTAGWYKFRKKDAHF
jgi:hypothetical protein